MIIRALKTFCLLVVILLSACMPASARNATLTVMAAASLTEPLNQLGKQFEQAHPGVMVSFNFAGSQQLAQQLSATAPADVFASANNSAMQAVIEAGRVAQDQTRVLVNNRLVVIVPPTNPAKIGSLADLAKPGLKLVLAAKEVPVGKYALEFLDKASADAAYRADYGTSVLENVVSYEENVKAVLAKVSLGEADAGIVYASDASGAVGKIDIPESLNVIAVYPIAPVKDCRQPELARAFIDFALSPDGQAILADYGFIPAP